MNLTRCLLVWTAAFATLSLVILSAAEPAALPLWPGPAPGEKGGLPPEGDTTKPTDQLIAGKRLIRLGNVSQPTIAVYRPAPEKDTGTAVIVCPGGGYHILAMDLEGTEVCEWLQSIGVTGVLLKYRVPKREGLERHAAPLEDAQRAVGVVRHRAAEWGIRPDRIGVLGFSAGAHLAAVVSSAPTRTYPPVDAADEGSLRPNFTVLVYPAYLAGDEPGGKVAPEIQLSTNTPPTFISISQDDPVHVENALNFTLGLKQAKVPFELHVYPAGGHGYGLRRTDQAVTTWPDRVTDWLRGNGWLLAPK